MRYAIDAHAIGQRLTGNEVYVRSLLSAFADVDKRSDFITYIARPEAEQRIPQRFEVRHVSSNPFARLGWQLRRSLRKERPALLHVQYTAPLFCPVPTVVSVHDVSFLEHPEYFTWKRREQLKVTVARSVKRAARVVTGSEFSRESIARAYGLDPSKIAVVPDAANPMFRPSNREGSRNTVRKSLGISGPFVLSVGDLQPRKNHIGLIHAFSELIHSHPQITHKLVLAGKDTWFGSRVREAARQSGAADRIVFTGFVTDEDLLHLYNACDSFVFPSFYEGFGIPVLEAMACGRAVIAANTSAIPEVADGAGLLFDPHRTDEIVRAMRDVLIDSELRARMERLGLQRAATFNWRKTARLTLNIYEEVAGRRSAASRRAPVSMHRG